jgi:hypothetical protein
LRKYRQQLGFLTVANSASSFFASLVDREQKSRAAAEKPGFSLDSSFPNPIFS